MPEIFSQEEAIFHAASAIEVPEQRSAYLDEACANQQELRQRVEALLRRCAEAQGPLDRPVPSFAATTDEPIAERPGTVIGPYKLLEQIGEGGFGVVFMAEQQEPIRRKVALKVLKAGMDTRQVIARFEAERQALALMDHPNIARVLDAGTIPTNPKSEARNTKQIQKPKSETLNQHDQADSDIAASDLEFVSNFGFRASDFGVGRPYFVMELVHGPSMTDYCDQHNVPVRERLELFVDVCQAVQHAHQKGIIHRDIKPSNVLVTLHDGEPVVKVIDFGIAKAMGQQLTERTLFTNFAQMIGTPLYMSPEQAEMSGLDVDTRSDIYSLGVLLYELLTGTTPFDKERLKQAGFDEIRRIIREEEPPKPSIRMSTVGQAATTASTKRGSDLRKLGGLFRGELDWIVMKALEKDRNRRYETASALAADVQRYLHDEAVQACPPSAWYRFRKFTRRNKVVLAIAASVLAALALGLGLATWQWRVAETQRQEAEQRRQIAESNFQRARLLLYNVPLKHQQWEGLNAQKGSNATWEENMEKALVLTQGLVTEPGSDSGDRLMTAEVHMMRGDIYTFLRRAPEAVSEYQKASVLFRQLVDELPKETGFQDSLAHCLWHIGWLMPNSTAEERDHKEQAFSDAISLYEGLSQEFRDFPWYRLQLALCWNSLARTRQVQGRFQQAEEAFRHQLALRQQLFDEFPREGAQRAFLAQSHNDLAWVAIIRPDRQPHHATEALEHAQKAVDLEPDYHNWCHTLGVAHCRLGHWKEALACIEKSRQLENKPGPADAWDRFFESMAYTGLGDRGKARRCYDEAVEWLEKNAPAHADLRRFRAEAAAMLGIEDKNIHHEGTEDTKKESPD